MKTSNGPDICAHIVFRKIEKKNVLRISNILCSFLGILENKKPGFYMEIDILFPRSLKNYKDFLKLWARFPSYTKYNLA